MEKISYDELYANAYNKSWSGWKKLGKIMEIVEILGRNILIATLIQRGKRIGQHIVNVFDEDALILGHCSTPRSMFSQRWSLAVSSNQYSLSIGRIS